VTGPPPGAGEPGAGLAILTGHVARFNAGVRGGDFGAMVDGFTGDAELVFEGIPVGPFRGRDAIAAAYRAQPPDDEIELLDAEEDGQGRVVATYAWRRRPGVPAGSLLLEPRDGRIARLVVHYGDDGRGGRRPAAAPSTGRGSIMDWKLELVVVPVSDVDRSLRFYSEQVGFAVDHDTKIGDELRFAQLTPPGSACSIAIGTGMVEAPPGSAKGLQLVVADVEAARAHLVERGVQVSPIQHYEGAALVEGRGGDWNSFIFFEDPDGNSWAVQERPARP
jgi:catechol 2,3-dioxygenase-like lactoylglutathione lyase family enzyme